VKHSLGGDQGLFTTEAVKAGDLLLCEKAFAHCYAGPPPPEENSIGSRVSLLMDIHTNQAIMGTQGDLIKTIGQKLWRNPSLVSEFASFYHGSYEPVGVIKVDRQPVVDT